MPGNISKRHVIRCSWHTFRLTQACPAFPRPSCGWIFTNRFHIESRNGRPRFIVNLIVGTDRWPIVYLRFLLDSAVPPNDCSFNQCSIRQRNNRLRACRLSIRTSELGTLDYDNRIDCLQSRLGIAEINSIRKSEGPQIAREQKKYARSLNERNARRREMNDNVISVRGSNERNARSAECASCFAKIGNSGKTTVSRWSIFHGTSDTKRADLVCSF